MPQKVSVIIPAAGSGTRLGEALPKQFLDLAGQPVLVHVVRAFEEVAEVGCIVLVVAADYRNRVASLIDSYHLAVGDVNIRVVDGGRRRQDSVAAGLAALDGDTDLVLVHDGARPLVSARLIRATMAGALRNGAAIAAIPVKDTLKAVADHRLIDGTIDRQGLWQAQTPQAVKFSILREAVRSAAEKQLEVTDEASLLEALGYPVTVVEGEETNIKITRPEDLRLAEAILMQRNHLETSAIRVGQGYDVHALVSGRPLVLGGIVIPHRLGLQGHSDADVLTHALCDAILGAIGGGDIGRHFPDTDPRYKGISSLLLLERVVAMAESESFELVNGDLTVIAQQPKLTPFFPSMQKKLAAICRLAPSALNLKATTTEGLGFAGRQEGIAASAVVLLQKV